MAGARMLGGGDVSVLAFAVVFVIGMVFGLCVAVCLATGDGR